MRKTGLNLVLMLVLATAFVPMVWAGGAQETETQVFLAQPPAYVAPGKPETGNDKLVIKNIQLKIDKNGTIKSYTLNIYNKRGEVVYTVADAKLEGRGFFGDLLNVGDIPQVKIPDTMNWPGTDSKGNLLPDGEYFYQLTVLDGYGKKTSSPPLSVVLDTKAPQVSRIGSNYRIFSPNGDKVRDTITFFQTTDAAWQWIQEIRAGDGTAVWSQTQTAEGDTAATDEVLGKDLVWDGKANLDSKSAKKGELLGEGSYKYVLTGIDRAKNKVEKSLDFTLSNSQSDLALGVKDEKTAMGPGQVLTFLPRIDDTKGLVGWKIEISNEAGIVWRSFSGTGQPPAELPFNGKGQPGKPDQDVQILKDGNYSAVLSAEYDSGTTVNSDEVKFLMDSLPPQAWISMDTSPLATKRDAALVFGGERKPELITRFRYENAMDWTVRLQKLQALDSAVMNLSQDAQVMDMGLKDYLALGRILDSQEASAGQTLVSLAWDGKLKDGTSLENGIWELSLTAIDPAGNVGVSNMGRFIMDKRPRGSLALVIKPALLLPGLKQDKDTVKVEVKGAVRDWVDVMTVQFLAKDGNSFNTQNSSRWMESLTWDGNRNNGQAAPDGQYLAKATVDYLNGDTATGIAVSPIFLSRKLPNAKVVPDRYTMSPNGDGRADTITFHQEAPIPADWTGRILDARGNVIKELTWAGSPADWTWDGLDSSGKALPDEGYQYQLTGTDANGIAGMVLIEGLRIDNLSDTLGISADLEVMSPNGDGYLDTLTISPWITLADELKAWTVEIRNEKGDSIKTWQGGSKLPEKLVWDGRNDLGTVVDGEYRLSLSAEYKAGSTASKQAEKPVLVVRKPPMGSVKVEPGIFSPDGDGDRDTVDLLLDARASDRPIKDWNVEVLDPTGQSFRIWSGTGAPPAKITWDGKSATGELVQSAMDYTVLFTLTDEVKNTHQSMTDLGVDILVMLDGDKLRIIIPNIEFTGNSSDLFTNARAVLENNLVTLRRLARILKRYDTYRITIEGHATYAWAKTKAEQAKEEKQELQPLSERRALEVKQALTILGIQWDRMNVKGVGGSRPVVSHDDMKNRWKNRRVEFILEK